MHRNCRLLPEDIVCKIRQINNIRRAYTCDKGINLLNEEITSDKQKHKQNIWKEHLDAHWDHRHHPHILWKTIHGQSNRVPPATPSHSTIKYQTHPNICFTKQFTNTVKHATHKTYRSIDRATQNIHRYNIILTPGVPQGGVLSPTLFNIYTSDLPPPNVPVQVMVHEMTSPSHPHARVQSTNIYNHTYIKFLSGQTKQSHTKSRQNNMHSVDARPCRIYEQSGYQNTQRFWVLP